MVIERIYPDHDTYTAVVLFERSLSNDMAVVESAEKFEGLTQPGRLMKQLRAELQEAYDEIGIGGSFQIVSLTSGPMVWTRGDEVKTGPSPADALRAIVARINGEFDNEQLVAVGPLSTSPLADALRIASDALTAHEQAIA